MDRKAVNKSFVLRCRWLTTILLLFFVSLLHAQENTPGKDPILAQAGNLIYENKYLKAFGKLNAYIRKDTTSSVAYRLRGRCLWSIAGNEKKEKYHEMVKADLSKALRLDTNAATLNAMGIYHDWMNKYYKPINYYFEAIAADSSFSVAYSNLALMYLYYFEYEKKAKNYFDKGVERGPYNHSTYYMRGLYYRYKNQDEKAVKDFNRSIELKSNESWVYFYRGEAHYATRQYKKAVLDFTKALKYKTIFDHYSKGNLAYLYQMRFKAYDRLDMKERAKKDYRKAQKLSREWEDEQRKEENKKEKRGKQY